MVMRRNPSKRKDAKRSVWTQNQRLQACSTWLMLGNLAQTAVATGVPIQTLETWKRSDWWKEACLKLQQEDLQQTTSTIKKIVAKALKSVEDRLDLGDAQYDQKTGEIVRVPVKAQVALKISTELLTKQEKLENQPIRQEIEKTVEDRLLKLSEEFAKFARAKQEAIDVPSRIVPSNT